MLDERQFLKKIDQFCDERINSIVDYMEKYDQFSLDSLKEMADLGLFGLIVPEEYGGSNLAYKTYSRVLMKIASVSVSLAIILSVHNSVAITPILYFGSEEQKKRYLPLMASGKKVGSFALTEPNAGSDASHINTTYGINENNYTINGTKIWITNSNISSVFITFATKEVSMGRNGISCFIVDRESPGFSTGKKENKLGLNGSDSMELIYDQCTIPEKNLIGREGDGFLIAMKSLENGRIGIAAISTGAMHGIISYIHKANVSNKPGYTGVMSRIIKWYELSQTYVERVSDEKDQNMDVTVKASIAKSFSSEYAFLSADMALSLISAYSADSDGLLTRMFKDTKVLSIVEGTNEIQDNIISKRYRYTEQNTNF